MSGLEKPPLRKKFNIKKIKKSKNQSEIAAKTLRKNTRVFAPLPVSA